MSRLLYSIAAVFFVAFTGAAVLMWFVSDTFKWGYWECYQVSLGVYIIAGLTLMTEEIRGVIFDGK